MVWASIISAILPVIQSIVGTAIGDHQKAAEITAQVQLALINKSAEADKAIAEAATAQAQVNLAEAQNPSIFVAGWRPAIGWICVLGLGYVFIFAPTSASSLGCFMDRRCRPSMYRR